MKLLSLHKKWILAAIGLLVVLLILKIGFILTAKPKITVDYVSEYNRITLPENFDPNDNATEYYQKVINAFVTMPTELRTQYIDRTEDVNQNEPNYPFRFGGRSREIKVRHINWPTDFNEADQNMLRQWRASNKQAFEYFRVASQKSYYWLERTTSEDFSMMGIQFPELTPLRYLVEAVIWNAKLNASQGQYQAAFDDIAACYRAGQHKCRMPSFLMEQLLGLSIKEKALAAAVSIIDRVEIGPDDLMSFQDAMQAEFDNDTYTIDFEVERLILYDVLQRTFVYNKRSEGRLSWSVVHYFETMCGSFENLKLKCKLFLSCLVGPTQNEMVRRIEETFASFEPLRTETPWQIHVRDPDYFERFNATHCYDCDGFNILDMFFVNPYRPFNKYHRVKAKEGALPTILAVIRFRAEEGMLPDILDDLVSGGYVQTIPLDPYSSGPLRYYTKEDNFTLYSIGEDFVDDGGKAFENLKRDSSGSKPPPGDIVFWPISRFEQRMRRLEGYFEEPKDVNAVTAEQ